MEWFGDSSIGHAYSSRSQQVRLISEDWIARNGYCLRCDSEFLSQTRANTRSRDFICEQCGHGYELKSKMGAFTAKILDGAYSAMISTIRNDKTPTFLLLEYSSSWSIRSLKAVHHSLITEASIQARRPLSPSAKRAGWIGCNIVLPAIAVEGQIPLLHEGVLQPKSASRRAFTRLENLASLSHADRGWAATILNFTNRLPSREFLLTDMYRFGPELQALFPSNRHIEPKIRQQLQILRDAGLVRFLGRGRYELTSRS